MAKKNNPLTKEFLELVRHPVYSVWNTIGSDCEACAQECGERLTNGAAIEGCIDAGRLSVYDGGENGKKADAAITSAIKAIGYDKVFKFLKENISLY